MDNAGYCGPAPDAITTSCLQGRPLTDSAAQVFPSLDDRRSPGTSSRGSSLPMDRSKGARDSTS